MGVGGANKQCEGDGTSGNTYNNDNHSHGADADVPTQSRLVFFTYILILISVQFKRTRP
jgi:hypothetical protein